MITQTRPTYKFSQNASMSSSQEFGNYFLKRGAGEIRKPTWNRTETVVRFLPQYNFAEGRWEPYRYSPDALDFGDWIRAYSAVRSFGENGISMLLYNPITDPVYDLNTNPNVILYKAINSAIDAKQSEADWPSLLKGKTGQRAKLSRHETIYIARCAIFRIKSKDMANETRAPLGLSSNDPAFFMELPRTAGEKLISMLEEKNDNFQGELDDYDHAFKYGDIVSLAKGKYVSIFEEGSDPKAAAQAATAAPRQLMVTSGGRGGYGNNQNKGFHGYDISMSANWNGFTAALNTPELEALIKSKQKPWEDCLQFFSHQEQAFLIQDGFPPRAILYAWRDYPEWIKPETRNRAVAKVSVVMDHGVEAATIPASPPKAGGWGQSSYTADATTSAEKDIVVPKEVSMEVNAPIVSAASEVLQGTVADREKAARAALEAAKAKLAGRSGL